MKKNPFGINEGARRMIFAGVPMSFLTVLTCIAMSSQLEHVVGEKAVAYVVYGTIMLVAVLGMITYNVTPKRLILPLGIIGWLISASILCWYAWFGPGAFGHTGQRW